MHSKLVKHLIFTESFFEMAFPLNEQEKQQSGQYQKKVDGSGTGGKINQEIFAWF